MITTSFERGYCFSFPQDVKSARSNFPDLCTQVHAVGYGQLLWGLLDGLGDYCFTVCLASCMPGLCLNYSWLSSRNLFQRGAKSLVMQISVVMLIFLLFSDKFFLGRSL